MVRAAAGSNNSGESRVQRLNIGLADGQGNEATCYRAASRENLHSLFSSKQLACTGSGTALGNQVADHADRTALLNGHIAGNVVSKKWRARNGFPMTATLPCAQDGAITEPTSASRKLL